MVSAAARRPVNFGRRRRNRRRRGVGGQKNFCKDFRKNFVLSSTFSDDLFRHRKLRQNNYAATMASAARRQIISGGAPINKSRRRHPQIVGGGAAGAQLYLQDPY